MNDTTVFDFLKLRVLSCYSESVMIKEGGMPPPRMAIVYPTYLCNHNCHGCDYSEENKTKKTFTENEFFNVITQLHDLGVKSIEFCGGGEPTLNPHLVDSIDHLLSYGMFFGLLTNGTMLTDQLKERLVKHGAYCRISLESASEDIFNRTKRPVGKSAGFDTVVNNIKALVERRNSYRQLSKLQISMKYAIDQSNYMDVLKAVELAKQLQVDSVQFKMIRNMPSELRDSLLINELMEGLEEKKKICEDDSFKVLFDREESRLVTKCWLSPLQVTIDPFGDLFICCYYRHRVKDHRLGNLFEKPLRDIWYSNEHIEKIEEINSEECNKYDCRFHFYNKLMWNLIMQDIGQLSFV